MRREGMVYNTKGQKIKSEQKDSSSSNFYKYEPSAIANRSQNREILLVHHTDLDTVSAVVNDKWRVKRRCTRQRYRDL
jgi:hypothetical protein